METGKWFSSGILYKSKKEIMKSFVTTGVVVILFSLSCKGQMAFDYNSFLSRVKAENPLAKKAYNNAIYSKVQYNSAKGNFDPQFNSTLENKHFNSVNYFTVWNTELKQQLYTSQYLKLGYQYGQGDFISPENYTPLVGIPFIGMQVGLLQGLMFDKNRAEVLKGKFYVDYYNAEEKIQLNNLLYISANAYFDFLYNRKKNQLYSFFLNLADLRLQGVKDMSSAGEKPIVDTIEASILLQSRILDMKSNEIDWAKKKNDLLVIVQGELLGNNNFSTNDSLELIYQKAKNYIGKIILIQNESNPLLLQYSAKQKVLETEVKLKKEMIKPVLDISYNFLNNNYNENLLNLNAENYKWGAKLSLPLYLRKPRNEYKMSVLSAQNNQFELENKLSQINFRKKYLIESIGILSQQILNAEKSSNYSKLLVDAEKTKFMNGESSLFLLNARENKWLEAELKLAEYKFQFLLFFSDLVYTNGNLTYELK